MRSQPEGPLAWLHSNYMSVLTRGASRSSGHFSAQCDQLSVLPRFRSMAARIRPDVGRVGRSWPKLGLISRQLACCRDTLTQLSVASGVPRKAPRGPTVLREAPRGPDDSARLGTASRRPLGALRSLAGARGSSRKHRESLAREDMEPQVEAMRACGIQHVMRRRCEIALRYRASGRSVLPSTPAAFGHSYPGRLAWQSEGA